MTHSNTTSSGPAQERESVTLAAAFGQGLATDNLIGAQSVIEGSDEDDFIDGTPSDDLIHGYDGHDFIEGLDGNDKIWGGNLFDVIGGGEGNDTLLGESGDDVLYGDAGDDVLFGDQGSDFMDGGTGNDLFLVNGFDEVTGDDGQDTISYQLANQGVTSDLTWGTSETFGENIESVENLTGSKFADHLSGDSHRNILRGGGGDDELNGAGGCDKLMGGCGDDVMTGGEGRDKIVMNHGGNDVARITSALDGNDIICGFSTACGKNHDRLDLDALFDSLDALYGPRAAHVELHQAGADTLVKIDTDNHHCNGFEMTVTLTHVTAANVEIGSNSSDEIYVGS